MEHNFNNNINNQKYNFNNFLPLISAFIVIILFALLKYFIFGPKKLIIFFADFMGGFFIVFGFLKIIKLSDFVESYSMYDLITKRYRIYGYIYPFIELTLGILYLIKFNLNLLNSITVIIMLLGLTGVANALSKKQPIECACMGTVYKLPMTYVTFFEDLFMAIMAIFMMFI